jgi:hypothetical protein
VVVGFGAVFAAIMVGAAVHLRRAVKNPPTTADEPDTGVVKVVDGSART